MSVKWLGIGHFPRILRKNCKPHLVHLIIVNEVSMVCNLNLTYLHLRLDDMYGSNDWFGSKNIIFVGDLLQLPPVNGRPVFQNVSSTIVKQRLGSGCAIHMEETVE